MARDTSWHSSTNLGMTDSPVMEIWKATCRGDESPCGLGYQLLGCGIISMDWWLTEEPTAKHLGKAWYTIQIVSSSGDYENV